MEMRTRTSYKGGHMNSTRNPGRYAGFLYLLLVVIAPFRLIYIPSALFVSGNATATANNIAAHELLFRLGIVSDLFCGIILIFLVLALYRLFKAVDQKHAVLMVSPVSTLSCYPSCDLVKLFPIE